MQNWEHVPIVEITAEPVAGEQQISEQTVTDVNVFADFVGTNTAIADAQPITQAEGTSSYAVFGEESEWDDLIAEEMAARTDSADTVQDAAQSSVTTDLGASAEDTADTDDLFWVFNRESGKGAFAERTSEGFLVSGFGFKNKIFSQDEFERQFIDPRKIPQESGLLRFSNATKNLQKERTKEQQQSSDPNQMRIPQQVGVENERGQFDSIRTNPVFSEALEKVRKGELDRKDFFLSLARSPRSGPQDTMQLDTAINDFHRSILGLSALTRQVDHSCKKAGVDSTGIMENVGTFFDELDGPEGELMPNANDGNTIAKKIKEFIENFMKCFRREPDENSGPSPA